MGWVFLLFKFIVFSIHGIVIDFVGTEGIGGLRLVVHPSRTSPVITPMKPMIPVVLVIDRISLRD